MNALPMHFWLLLALCLLAVALLWWFTLGSRHVARRRLLRGLSGACARPSPGAPDEAALAGMRRAIAQACETQLRSPAPRAVHSPLYAIPWFLFIGDAAADVPGLLAAARGAAPGSAPADHGTPGDSFWRWWRLPSLTAIETRPAVVGESAAPRTDGLWHQALAELAGRRDRLPLNGIVVCMSAACLQGNAQAIESTAARLRHRLNEAAAALRLHLPVYLVVTGLEQLAGYETVRAALPSSVLGQALGHRLAGPAAPGHAADWPADLFAPIALRLHALRMALLRGAQSADDRLAIHAFVEQLRALQPGLHLLAGRLFEEGHAARTARWRGLYLVAAPSPGGGGAFASDLFQRFLPADQPLAHP